MYATFEALMKQRGETFSDVARAIGCRPSTFTDWRAGRYTPKRDKLEAIAKHFGITLSQLTGDEEISEEMKLSADEWTLIKGYRIAIYPIRKIMLDAAMEALKGGLEKSSISNKTETA